VLIQVFFRSNDENRLDQISLSTNIFTTVNAQKSNGKHLWVRMALTSKLLDKIADYLVLNYRYGKLVEQIGFVTTLISILWFLLF